MSPFRGVATSALLGTGMAALVLALPVAAGAQVSYDPSSSAGKQYEIPVQAVRTQAGTGKKAGSPSSAGASGNASSGVADTDLFGQGIQPSEATVTSATAGTHSGESTTSKRPGSVGSREADASVPRTSVSGKSTTALSVEQARSVSSAVADSGSLAWVVYALAATLACALLTLLLRRAVSGEPPASSL